MEHRYPTHPFKFISRLKHLDRTGWVREGVEKPESVASHSYGVAMLVLALNFPPHVNKEKMLKMALYHDLAESIIGDIVWEHPDYPDYEIKLAKEREERDAIENLEPLFGEEFSELCIEYLDQSSKEARMVKSLDKLDMAMQATLYSREGYRSMDQFIRTARKYLPDWLEKELDQMISGLE